MTMSKEYQQVNNRLTETENTLARMEAKLDALMKNNMKAEDLKNVKLPEPKKTEKISSAAPYTIKEPPVSTTEIPESPTSEVVNTSRTPELEHKDTTPVPVVRTDEPPTPNYDTLTEGEAIKLVKDSDQAKKSQIVEYERAHKNRTRVIDAAAVNAPSE